eukprot:IDg17242t1
MTASLVAAPHVTSSRFSVCITHGWRFYAVCSASVVQRRRPVSTTSTSTRSLLHAPARRGTFQSAPFHPDALHVKVSSRHRMRAAGNARLTHMCSAAAPPRTKRALHPTHPLG